MTVCFSRDGFMFFVVILVVMVWEECLLHVELDFLVLKFKNFFVENVCSIGEHYVDTQGFPPCCTTPNRLSFWEEAKVKL